MKTFKEIILESKKLTAKDLVKLFKNKEDWGDMGERVRVVKGNLEVVDSYFYGGDRAMKQLKDSWTTPNGTNAKFFKDEYGITFELVDAFEMVKATGRYKKITSNGIVGIILKIK